MAGETNLAALIKGMTPQLNEGQYVFVTVADSNTIDRASILCEFKEAEGATLVLRQQKADEYQLNYDTVFAWITLHIHSSLDAVGLTAAFSSALADESMSCNVIAGYYHDHLFVNLKDGEKAITILRRLSED